MSSNPPRIESTGPSDIAGVLVIAGVPLVFFALMFGLRALGAS
jgi:hypothetical protein